MNCDLERILRKAAVAYSRYYTGFCQETEENHIKIDIRFDWDSKPAPSERKSKVSSLHELVS
jgi:hypothetical protein